MVTLIDQDPPRGKENCSDAQLLQRLQHNDEEAAALLFRRYARRLRAFARANCSLELASRIDPDDIVQAAFLAFFQQAAQGRYHAEERDDLWKLLAIIALNHIRSAGEHHRAAKRDVRLTLPALEYGMDALSPAHHENEAMELQLFLSDLLQQVPSPQQRAVQLRLEGYEVAEIAQLTGQSKRTVERGLHSFRVRLQEKWERV